MLIDFQTLVDTLVPLTLGDLTAEDRDQAIALAVTRYAADRPRTLVVDVAAGGAFLALPAGWVEGVSSISGIECPPDAVPPRPIDGWCVEQGLDGRRIRLPYSPAADATVRIAFTAPHVVDETTDTIPAVDREAVANWAAALLLDALSNRFAGDRTPTIASDSVDHASKTRDFAARARTARQLYLDHLGIDPKRNNAAGVVMTIPSIDSLGRPRHNRRGPAWL
ncbi:conserved hypothetical protein [uncultured Alphaproteobacteria bacterium]|uniref:Uncharacterized protein n=1 Tax=uncultured Alphaproteobacteria bacterium TaxID=91750 RepID=A0A212KK25_9PROT|nr:conserved hypothetical protein [uncultured Alphaproteobacteria bacterium]